MKKISSIGKSKKVKKGKFIVVDGIDGAGKTTQTQLLIEALSKNGKKVKTIKFPQYNSNFLGKLVGECLSGQHGDFLAVAPKIASVLYAADRYESSREIRSWLDSGYTVIADRYTSSNQIHQGSKCKNDKERKEFLTWIDQLEHEIFGIPRPDVIVYLSLPLKVSMDLIAKRNESVKSGKDKNLKKNRAYAKGGKDQAEESSEHLEASRQSALKIIKARNNWKKIECFEKGRLLSIPEVHERVMEAIK